MNQVLPMIPCTVRLWPKDLAAIAKRLNAYGQNNFIKKPL